jgi:hypothetical protein
METQSKKASSFIKGHNTKRIEILLPKEDQNQILLLLENNSL